MPNNQLLADNHLVVFNDQQIRSVTHNDEWFYSMIDIIRTLADSITAKGYRLDLKIKLANEEGFQRYDLIVPLQLVAADGKNRPTYFASTEGILRIIQSIP